MTGGGAPVRQPRLGVDFGGVIVPAVGRAEREDTHFSDAFLETPPQPGAYEALRTLVTLFDGHVWIVSKAGQRIESLTRTWLQATDFFAQTGFDDAHLSFCRERSQKQEICAALKITHFVDDGVHIMQILRDTVPHLYLFGADDRHRASCPWATAVSSWTEARTAILRDLPDSPVRQ